MFVHCLHAVAEKTFEITSSSKVGSLRLDFKPKTRKQVQDTVTKKTNRCGTR
jgi:hypothetical protein